MQLLRMHPSMWVDEGLALENALDTVATDSL